MGVVRRHGRNHEPELLLRYFLRTNPLGLAGQAPLGLAMWRRKRMSVLARDIGGKAEVEAIFRKSLELDGARGAEEGPG